MSEDAAAFEPQPDRRWRPQPGWTWGNAASILATLVATIGIVWGASATVTTLQNENISQNAAAVAANQAADQRISTVAGDVAKLEGQYERDVREMRQSLSRIEIALGTKVDRSELDRRHDGARR